MRRLPASFSKAAEGSRRGDFASQAVRNNQPDRNSLSRLCVRQINFHSARTLLSPRKLNRENRRHPRQHQRQASRQLRQQALSLQQSSTQASTAMLLTLTRPKSRTASNSKSSR